MSNPLAKKALRELRRAHELNELGKHLEAGGIFEQLAREAQLRSLPQYPQLLLQAGRSNIQGGDHEKGVDLIKTALGGLVELGRLERVAHLQPGLRALFMEHDLETSWHDIQNTLGNFGIGSQMRPLKSLRLPAKCPYCGASLVPEELDDISKEAGICGYCGSYVLAGENMP